MTIDQKSKSFSCVHVVFDQRKDNVWLTKISVREGTQHFPKSYCMNQASESRTLRAFFFYTFGIMLSQFAAVECKVLIQAGRGSLSRLCFLQHKGKLEQMLILHLRNRGMDASFQRNDFWDADLAGRALLVIG